MASIKKRDNTIETYDSEKIKIVILKAFQLAKYNDINNIINSIIDKINEDVHSIFDNSRKPVDIEIIQDNIENILMDMGLKTVAKSYILYRKERENKRSIHGYDLSKIPDDITTPWGEIGYITYKRTYARTKESNEIEGEITEELRDTVLRILKSCQTQLKVGFTNNELKLAYKYMMGLKGILAGRFLWQMGTNTVDKLGIMSLQNCAFVKIDEPIKPFLWIFDILMLGTGVGANIQKSNVSLLPPLLDNNIQITRKDTKDADFIIPDSREGWVSLLEKVLEAYFYKGNSFSYSTLLIRSAGSPIKGFGGVASGPEDLCKGIKNITDILDNRQKNGLHLTPVDCMDIIDIIATVVVAGNVRRAAIIIIGDADDEEYLDSKNWASGNIPNWRAMSNNSVICNNIDELPQKFWDNYMGNSEPFGLVNLNLARTIGRTKDGSKYPDPTVDGANPCCEQFLSNKETCCLSEIFLPNIDNYDELVSVATILYRICKHSLLLPCHHKETENIIHKNLRMGIGITGYMMCNDEKKAWLSPLYEHLREFDRHYSFNLNIPCSVKLTTVKPSGTLSSLAGVTNGVHPGIFKYFIRRIRISSVNNLVKLCKKNGFKVEFQKNFDGTDDLNTCVVEFPCKYPEGTVLANTMSAVDQLEIIKKLQHDWSDNAVSVTIYYRKEELPLIQNWLRENYTDNIKSCSFLLHYDHGFIQAPYEEISEKQYNELVQKVTPITKFSNFIELDENSADCPGGACPIR
jgi:ribonucleoside-triphosphate reductase